MKKSEGNAMKKDIEWLKEEIGDLPITDTVFISDGVSYVDSAVSVMSVYDLIDQLEESEVLSQELPVIPKFVAEWVTNHREKFDLYPALKKLEGNPFGWERTYEWYRVNTHEFVNVYLTGEYEVEAEPLYYALIKGHELIAGEDACKYWKCDMRNGSMFLSNRCSHYGRYLAEMSKNDWGKFDINDTNADFVRVDD